eukprot:10238717-Alexandrium_andersonii.AAC.1
MGGLHGSDPHVRAMQSAGRLHGSDRYQQDVRGPGHHDRELREGRGHEGACARAWPLRSVA